MAEDLFLITGGGTGAKIAEALLHLCAAGLGPERAHILLIDSDTANGNLNRTSATIGAYRKMERWPWSVQANVRYGLFKGSEAVWLKLFGTEIFIDEITEPIQTVFAGGLETAVNTEEMHQVLDLLYDEAEQAAKCDDGFRARPNLGCLLMADHLNEKLPLKAGAFLEAMRAAAGGNQTHIPVVVTASVFGGTGASLLPIIRGCVERILRKKLDESLLARFEWGAVKLLPHYQPNEKKDSVDPDRYLLDTASSLQFYSTVYHTSDEQGRYDAMYIVGSDKPGRNRVKTILGHSRQANPAYFEEVMAALAILHFADEGPHKGQLPMRIYDPDRLSWETLPFTDWDMLRKNLAYLLHLAAFYMRRGDPSRAQQMSQGIGSLMRTISDDDLMKYPWYKEILDQWADFHAPYKAAKGTRRVGILKNDASMGEQSIDAMLESTAEYFGRLLLWAETALKGEHLDFLDHSKDNYAGLYGVMSDIKAKEIDVKEGNGSGITTIQPEEDNGLVRLLRTAVTAMVHEHQQATKGKRLNTEFVLVDREDKICLRTTLQQTKDMLREFGRGTVIDEYTRTLIRISDNGES